MGIKIKTLNKIFNLHISIYTHQSLDVRKIYLSEYMVID